MSYAPELDHPLPVKFRIFCAALSIIILAYYIIVVIRPCICSILRQHGHVSANTGLGQPAIAALPKMKYKRHKELYKDGDLSVVDECAICLSGIDGEEMVRLLLKCKHLFHVDCIDMWFYSHSTCPVCRTAIELSLGLNSV